MIAQEQAQDRRIVVGVDNSAGSAHALRWALAYARQTGGSVEAVTAWQVPAMYAYAYGWTPTGIDDAGIIRYAEKSLTETVTQVLGAEDNPVAVTTRVIDGPAAQVLLTAGKGAELLVLGNHRHGALRNAVFGSVALRCMHDATCPVVVVPRPE